MRMLLANVMHDHSESLMLGKLPLALYGATFQLLEGTLVSYTPQKLVVCLLLTPHARATAAPASASLVSSAFCSSFWL